MNRIDSQIDKIQQTVNDVMTLHGVGLVASPVDIVEMADELAGYEGLPTFKDMMAEAFKPMPRWIR